MPELSLLGVFAHPDDEQVMSGTFAQAAADGVPTGLICATRGEVGEIADPSLATPDTLGQVREAEMRAAAAVLGIKYLWFLDYRDSGMVGTPPNDDPTCLHQANEEEALAKIVRIIREFKPTIIITFDRTGGYGHPDHLMIYRLTTLAFDAAADPQRFPEAGEAWQTGRLFYSSFPRSSTSRFGQMLKDMGVQTDFPDMSAGEFGLPDEEITNEADVKGWTDLKERSLNHHKTQMNPNSPFARFPKDFMEELRSREYFALAGGTPLPQDPAAGGDLFAGLRP